MSAYAFQPPAMPEAGSTDEKLRVMYSYLYRMNEYLQVALNGIETGVRTGEIAAQGSAYNVSSGGQSGTVQQVNEYNSLKALIVQTATQVRHEMDLLETQLASEYVAVSDFGAYQESMESVIRATADALIQEYNFESRLQDLSDSALTFDDYRITTSQYIKTGLLYFDDTTGVRIPRYGVAVGENLTTTVVDDKEVITRMNLCATFTSDKLSFWMGGVEVAYVSNNKLYINNAEITGQLIMGNWRIDRSNGFLIQWIGG